MRFSSDMLHEYAIEAATAAVYPGAGTKTTEAMLYRGLGLNSECGEVAGVAKRMLRDHGGVLTPELRDEMILELGDVMWYVAEILRCHNVGDRLASVAAGPADPRDTIPIVASVMCMDATAAAGTLGVSRAVLAMCSLIGVEPDEVLRRNLAKLQSRKARGVIHGSGGDR